jgi:hypothetical protein
MLPIGKKEPSSILWVISLSEKKIPINISHLLYLGPDEYFYRRIRTNTNADNDDTPVSSNSSIRTNEARIGELDEFDKMIQRYQQKHSK